MNNCDRKQNILWQFEEQKTHPLQFTHDQTRILAICSACHQVWEVVIESIDHQSDQLAMEHISDDDPLICERSEDKEEDAN